MIYKDAISEAFNMIARSKIDKENDKIIEAMLKKHSIDPVPEGLNERLAERGLFLRIEMQEDGSAQAVLYTVIDSENLFVDVNFVISD